MNAFATRLENVTEAHLEQLISTGISESRTIEYKAELPRDGRDDKLEFLRDVASFANSAGGYIVYGMKSKDGIPIKLAGYAVRISVTSRCTLRHS